jgi:hypothetical protein
LEEDFDPTIVDEIFSLYLPYPDKLASFLNFTIEKGIEEAASKFILICILTPKGEGNVVLSELGTSETLLKEYLLSVGKSWWSKTFKKPIETIYKQDVDVRSF